MTPSLGKLERVDLRDVWETEDRDFTPWLAREDNLAILGDTLEMELELQAQEKNVGPFRADILCTNTGDGTDVLIENQLEKTDHTHLGQLLTYAAGLHTVTIIWIAAKFTDEHRAALDWLNEITDPKFKFFGMEVELWRIGESLAAPKFNIICKPNEWARSVSQSAQGNRTETQKMQYDYWVSFKDYAERQNSHLRFKLPRPEPYCIFSLGSNTQLVASLHFRAPKITVYFQSLTDTAKAYFDLLYKRKEQIEAELGFAPEWDRHGENKRTEILLKREVDIHDLQDRDKWPEFHQWMLEHLEKFEAVFRPLVKQIDPSEWINPER